MLDEANKVIKDMQRAVESIGKIKKLLGEAQQLRNFAVVYKDDVPYFMMMTDDQARVVNGIAMPITDLPSVSAKAREVILGELTESLKAHEAVLTPMLKPAAPTRPQAATPRPPASDPKPS